jgi:hypothetical protein
MSKGINIAIKLSINPAYVQVCKILYYMVPVISSFVQVSQHWFCKQGTQRHKVALITEDRLPWR